MYRGKKYKVIPYCADPAFLPALAYTIVLYILLDFCLFLTGYDSITAIKEINFPDWIVYRSIDSDIPDSRVFAITIDEWVMAASGD